MKLEEITNSIESKLSKEDFAKITDDMVNLLTLDKSKDDTISNLETKNQELTKTRDMLMTSNSNLLQKIAVSYDETQDDIEKAKPKEEKKAFSFRDCFDEKGNFKR